MQGGLNILKETQNNKKNKYRQIFNWYLKLREILSTHIFEES